MKKHFLLLVMALMSMASWAATDISGSDFAVRAKHTVTYGTVISAADFQVRDVAFQSDLTATTDYTVEGVYTNSSCTLEADYPYEVGTVYVKLEGAGNYTGTKTASISITPKEIYVALKWNANEIDNPDDDDLVTTPLEKTYGENDPTFTLDWSQTDFVEGGLADTDIEGTPVLAAHSNDVAWSEPEEPAEPEVIGVDIELEGLTSQNYVIKLNPAFETEGDPLDFTKMIINPKDLDDITPAPDLNITAVYQGKEIEPSFTITDGENTLSVENGDFTYAYGDDEGAGRNVSEEPWEVTITGQGNYTGEMTGYVTITPAPMRVAVKNIKVPYKGAAYNAAYLADLPGDLDEDNDPEYVYYGFVGEDAAAEASAAISATITPELVLTIGTADGTAIDANAEGYALAINVDAVELDNYELEALESQGKLIIEKAKVTITANQARAQVYGKAETPIGYTVAYATPVAARQTAGADTPDESDDVYEKVFSTEPVFTHAEITGINDYDITLVSEGVATANFEVTKYVVTEYNEAGTARVDGTPVYSVIAAPITVVVLNHNKTYGQADPEELNAPVAGTDYIVSGLDDTSVLAGMTLTREDDSENVGEYELKAVLAEDMGDNFTLTCIPGKLIINPKELKVTAKAQTLAVGDDEEDLDLSAYTIDSSTPLVGEDEADAVFALAFDYVPATEETYEEVDVTADTYESFETLYVEGDEPGTYALDETGEYNVEQTYYILVEAQEASGSLKDNIDPATEELVLDDGKDEQSFAQGIIVKLLSPNYKLVATAGKLTVIDATELVLLDDATDLSELEASDGPVKVTFASRELKANAWNTLWLPFNTTVKEVSSALGYALVDMLQEDATSDELNFKIHIGEIPAYTPFLVKTAEDVDMAEVKMKGEIVAPVEANMTKENKSYLFKSNLKPQVIGESFWTTGPKMEGGNFVFNKYKATANLKALRAYIVAKPGVSGAPIINIEEADGTITAINTAKSEISTNAEGWYTIGGVKLQGAPTQKGIFIQNGKKVVIK